MFSIMLDPGHGGKDPGATYKNLKEKDLALRIGKGIKDTLSNNKDIRILLTRDTDRFIDLTSRTLKANMENVNLFISLHHNAGGGTGFESYIFKTSKNKTTYEIQSILHQSMKSFLIENKIIDRGAKKANFLVLRKTYMPAILIESLFLDTVQDFNLLNEEKFIKAYIEELSETILKIIEFMKKEKNLML